MRKVTLIDILNPTKLRDWLNKLLGLTNESPQSDVTVGYGLSKVGNEISLGTYDEDTRTHVISTPEGEYEALLIGRYLPGYNRDGFFKTKGVIQMIEGDAMVSIQDDTKSDQIEGVEPVADGKNRLSLSGYRASILANDTIVLACSQTSGFSPALRVTADNNVFVYNNDYEISDFVVINKKMLESRLKNIEERLSTLENPTP